MELLVGGRRFFVTEQHIKRDDSGKELIRVWICRDSAHHVVQYPNNQKMYFCKIAKARELWAKAA